MSLGDEAGLLYRAVERFADWIKFEDAKAGAILVLLAIGTTDLVANARRLVSSLGVVASISFWISAALAAVTIALVVLTLFPRVKPEGGTSLFFFGSVARYESADKFRAAVAQTSDDELVRQLASQA